MYFTHTNLNTESPYKHKAYVHYYSSMHLLKTNRMTSLMSLQATNSTQIPVIHCGTDTIYRLEFSFPKCTGKTLIWDCFTSRISPATPISLTFISNHNSLRHTFSLKPQDKTPFFHKNVWKSKPHHSQHYSRHIDCHSNFACSFCTSYTNIKES
jgi:hypothetical protein